MFIMFSISSICALFNIKDENFVKYNKNYLIVNLKKINVDDYLSFEQKENINYILPGNSLVSMKININDYYQTSKMGNSISGSLSSYEMINKDNLIYGRMPENDTEVVVDKMIIDNAFDNILDAKFDINPKRVGKDNIGCSFCKYSDICFMKEEDVVLLDEHNNLDFL